MQLALTTGSILLLLQIAPARANIFKDVWGVVTDPLKLNAASGQVSASLYRTMLQADELEAKGDMDVAARLTQIQGIVDDALSGSRALEAQAAADMTRLEQKVNADANNTIYNVQCVAETSLNDSLQRAASQLLEQVRASHWVVRLLGFNIIDFGPTVKVSISDPDQAYWSLKTTVLGELARTQSDSSPAYDIISAYQNLERMAKLTTCYYKQFTNQEFVGRFISEANNMEVMTLQWTSVVDVANPFRARQ